MGFKFIATIEQTLVGVLWGIRVGGTTVGLTTATETWSKICLAYFFHLILRTSSTDYLSDTKRETSLNSDNDDDEVNDDHGRENKYLQYILSINVCQ